MFERVPKTRVCSEKDMLLKKPLTSCLESGNFLSEGFTLGEGDVSRYAKLKLPQRKEIRDLLIGLFVKRILMLASLKKSAKIIVSGAARAAHAALLQS